MDVPVLQSVQSCDLPRKIGVYLSGDTLTRVQQNQLTRVNRTLSKKSMSEVLLNGTCFGDTTALVLVDGQRQVRGMYYLEQTDVNRLFAELDILRMNESYGQGVSR